MDVEEAIDQEFARAEAGHVELLGGLLALRFYLKRVVEVSTQQWAVSAAGVTNYVLFLRHLDLWRRSRDERVLLVTFNYDTMLEGAAESVLGLSFTGIESYTDREDYRLYKPHGSVNWVHDTVLPATEGSVGNLVARAEEVTQDLAMVITEPRDQIRLEDGSSRGRATVPALAVPTVSKRTFVCPANHLDDLRKQMRLVDRILIVGWRAREAHYLNVMRERLDPSVLCMILNGPNGGNDVRQQLRRETRLRRFTSDQRVGFSDAISAFEPTTNDLLT